MADIAAHKTDAVQAVCYLPEAGHTVSTNCSAVCIYPCGSVAGGSDCSYALKKESRHVSI